MSDALRPPEAKVMLASQEGRTVAAQGLPSLYLSPESQSVDPVPTLRSVLSHSPPWKYSQDTYQRCVAMATVNPRDADP